MRCWWCSGGKLSPNVFEKDFLDDDVNDDGNDDDERRRGSLSVVVVVVVVISRGGRCRCSSRERRARANGVRERVCVRVQNAAPFFFFFVKAHFLFRFKYVCFFLYLIRDLSPFFDPTRIFSLSSATFAARGFFFTTTGRL